MLSFGGLAAVSAGVPPCLLASSMITSGQVGAVGSSLGSSALLSCRPGCRGRGSSSLASMNTTWYEMIILRVFWW